MFDDVGAQIITHLVGRPFGAPEQVLEALGLRVVGLFGQLPTVLALDRREQRTQISGPRLPGSERGKRLLMRSATASRLSAQAVASSTVWLL